MRYDAVGFDLLTALLDTLPLWRECAADDGLGERWHARSQARLRGRPYHPFEDNVRAAAIDVGVSPGGADALLVRWGEFAPWPDSLATLAAIPVERRFVVTNCSQRLADRAAARLGAFALVMTAERAGAYKPDPRPYRAALEALSLDPRRVLFVAGSAHDVAGAGALGMDVYWANRLGAPPPTEGRALREARDLSGLAELLA
jgi:2-haloalkanoic acid dehalogenase type II